MKKSLKIVHLSSEISPYSKSGGLADVVRSLPRALRRLGHEVIVITPSYGFIKNKDWPLENLSYRLKLDFAGEKYHFGFKKTICPDNYPVFFICQRRLFGSRQKKRDKMYAYPDNGLRFLLFDLAALELIKFLGINPHVIHCHDWHTALVPGFLKLKKDYKEQKNLKKTATLFTIHNLLFQGPKDWWKVPLKERDDGKGLPKENSKETEWLNFMKRGIIHADIINTVSLRYAREILTPEFGCLLEKQLNKRKNDIYGVVNGVDYAIFNPEFDQDIYVNYDANFLDKKIENKRILQEKYGLKVDTDIPLIGLANRLTEQKGFELIVDILDYLLKKDLQVAVVGTGVGEKGGYVDIFKKFKRKYPKKLLFVSPFKEGVARKIYAASDIYLMPSRFEPCGISQLISLRYGSIPVVHSVGGLSDTVINYNPRTEKGNGFVFSSYQPQDLLFALARALENYQRKNAWRRLVSRAMRESYSWTLPAKKYLALYKKAMNKTKKNEH